jgi:DNA mismatch repair protein MutH
MLETRGLTLKPLAIPALWVNVWRMATRDGALRLLRELIGQDLCVLAGNYGIRIWREGSLNKGWAGRVLEHYLGSSHAHGQVPDFGDWELKLVSLKRNRRGNLAIKETMAITMINPDHVVQTPFEKSHLFNKMQRMIVVARIYQGPMERCSLVSHAVPFDLERDVLLRVKADYDFVRNTIRQGATLSGKMGVLVQPRTKGPGYGSATRAFYARPRLIKQILGI